MVVEFVAHYPFIFDPDSYIPFVCVVDYLGFCG